MITTGGRNNSTPYRNSPLPIEYFIRNHINMEDHPQIQDHNPHQHNTAVLRVDTRHQTKTNMGGISGREQIIYRFYFTVIAVFKTNLKLFFGHVCVYKCAIHVTVVMCCN